MCPPPQLARNVFLSMAQKRSAQFDECAQELRYECDSQTRPASMSQITQFYKVNSAWRAAMMLDGSMYFYNSSTHETCWERPARTDTEVSIAIGDQVEVFSDARQCWCSGYVEKLIGANMLIAFQLPGATREAWMKRELSSGHRNLRGIGGKCVLPVQLPLGNNLADPAVARNYENTKPPENWTLEEQDAYSQFWEEATDGAVGTPRAQQLADYFLRSGLKQQAVNEVWQVANPDLKPSLGPEEFRVCCRLMAHCQALSKDGADPGIARALKKGGQKLRSLLRCQCLPMPPPRLPKFA